MSHDHLIPVPVFPAQITRYECPIGTCPWTHDEPGPDAMAGAGATVEEAALDALIKHVTGVEAVVKAHLEKHSLLEWVHEVMRLRDEAATRAWRGEQDALIVVAALLGRLGGTAEFADAELAAVDRTVVREPVMNGFRLTVSA